MQVYVEYSNEVWNSQFTQNAYAAKQGVALGLADAAEPWVAAWLYTSYRSVQIFDIFEEVSCCRVLNKTALTQCNCLNCKDVVNATGALHMYVLTYRRCDVMQVFGSEQRSRLEFILPTQAANPYVTDQIISFQVYLKAISNLIILGTTCSIFKPV